MTPRHSYTLKIKEPVADDPDDPMKTRVIDLSLPRAEGHNVDAAIREARRLVHIAGRIPRSVSISSQERKRPRGPVTGCIIVVVHPASIEGAKGGRPMRESRIKRGIPPEVAK